MTLAHVVLTATLVVWSFSFLAAAWLRRELSVAEALAARFVPVFVGAALLIAARWPPRIPKDAWPRLVLMGLLSVPAYNAFFFIGLKTVPTGTAALVIALNPVFTAVLARLLLGEPFGARRALGLALSLLGLFVVIRFGTDKPVDAPYVMSALVLALAPLSWALYTVVGRGLPRSLDPMDATFASILIGSAPLVAFGSRHLVGVLAKDPATLAAALYLGIACTLAGYAAWLWSLKRLPAGEVSAFVFLNPPLANLWAWALQGAALKPPFVVGGIVLLAGMGLIILRRSEDEGRSLVQST